MSPINRGPFNTLVDDSGTGTTGTPWNKQAIKDVILDPVDAVLGSGWSVIPFDPANFWPGVASGHVGINYAMVMNKTLFWTLQIVAAPVPSPATGGLLLTLPLSSWQFNNNSVLSPVARAHDTGVGDIAAHVIAFNPQSVQVVKSVGGNWIGPLCYVYFTAVMGLQF